MDELARLRAEMDQMKEGMKEYASSLWTFYSECVEQGFKPEQALTLTLNFMTSQMENFKGDDE